MFGYEALSETALAEAPGRIVDNGAKLGRLYLEPQLRAELSVLPTYEGSVRLEPNNRAD